MLPKSLFFYISYEKYSVFNSKYRNYLAAPVLGKVEVLYMSDVRQIFSQTWFTDGIEIGIKCFSAFYTRTECGCFETSKEYFKVYRYILYTWQGVLQFIGNTGK